MMTLNKRNSIFLVLTAILTLMLVSAGAWASYYRFGYNGSQGTSGWDGRSGRDGQDVTVTANGEALSLILNGEDATDGGDARMGEDAYSCSHGRPNHDLEGAQGGDGGRGGQGGRGGNAGDITVYSAGLSNLSRVFVSAEVGRGGRSGRGGEGGRPCYCRENRWVNTICHKEKDKNGKEIEVCNKQTFYCRDGVRGSYGHQPSAGSDGVSGRVIVIPQLGPLPITQPNLQLSILNILNGPFTLSKNIWHYRSGARALFAPGSRISDSFTLWDRKQEYLVRFEWLVRRPLSDFSGSSVSLGVLADQGPVGVEFPSEIWEEQSSSMEGPVQKTTITKAVKESETQQLSVEFQGTGTDFAILLTDAASYSDLLNTSFTLKLEKKRVVDHKTLFEDEVPASAVDASGGKFLIHAGKLPGVEKGDLKPGNKLKVNLIVKRSLGSNANARSYEDLKYELP